MGNFLQWNNAAVNQETDAEYAADPQRTGGAVDDSPFPSATANKVFYQSSTFIAAFAAMMAAKGFPLEDDSLSVLQAVLANVLTSADQLPQIATVAYSPTPAYNAGATAGFQMTLAGSVSSATLTGAVPGQLYAFYFVQDATGGRTVAWPTNVTGGAQPDPAAGILSLQLFRADLAGTLRAATPMISSGGAFTASLLSAVTFTLAGGAPVGAMLIGNGTSYAARQRSVAIFTSGSGRLFNTVYTNTTEAEMEVAVTSHFSGLVGTNAIVVNGVELAAQSIPNLSGAQGFCSAKVQPGQTYEVTNDNLTLTTWVEYTWV